MTTLPLLTNSRLKAFRRCARLHFYSYELGYRPVEDAEALRFGTLIHLGLEAWWQALLPVDDLQAACERRYNARGGADGFFDDLETAIFEGRSLDASLLAVAGCTDPFEKVRAEEMLHGYHLRWQSAGLVPIAVEVEFTAPLVNPETGAPSRTFQLAGKLDVLARDVATGRVVIIEHKSSSEDITPGSPYWSRLRIDGQVSQYFAGARALGYEPAACIYDVLAKPFLRPAKATPMEERKYTLAKFKACPYCKKKGGAESAPHDVAITEDPGGPRAKCEPDPEDPAKRRVCTDPGGKLYANLRAEDETPEEYRARLVEVIAYDPIKFFARGEVVRLEQDELEHAGDTWQIARDIRDAELGGERLVHLGKNAAAAHPRNPDACVMWGRTCSFFAVCTGAATLDDARFQKLDNVHQELAQSAA